MSAGAPSPSDKASALSEAAFGATPGLFPLPPADDARSSWYRSVALAGQGRYAAAAAQAQRWPRVTADIDSLRASTRASWLRQLGRHDLARRFDGRALLLAPAVPVSDIAFEARCDALIGLAADSLGVGALGWADALLVRCGRELDHREGESLWRPMLRLSWVRAELAMAMGDGETALRHAGAARKFADDTDSLRHRIKTSLILAAALSCVGDDAAAHTAAVEVVEAARAHGQLPLQWAAAMLSEAMTHDERASRGSLRLASVIADRGGTLLTRPGRDRSTDRMVRFAAR